MDVIRRIAERKIEEAIAAGVFDNLPGLGKPIDLDSDTSLPPHERWAAKLLKDAGALPEWVEIDREVERLKAERSKYLQDSATGYSAWQKLIGTNAASEDTPARFAKWVADRRNTFLQTARLINDLVLKHNLTAPISAHAPSPLSMDKEATLFDEQCPPLSYVETSTSEPSLPERESRVRAEAEWRYQNKMSPS
jgi:hypothetical protein